MSWTHASRRHGIARHAARFFVEHCGLVYIQQAPPDSAVPDPRLVYLGDDEAGQPIEVIGVEMEVGANGEGHLRVIHAMALRDKYRGQYEEAERWRV
jgi:hypothetical protein